MRTALHLLGFDRYRWVTSNASTFWAGAAAATGTAIVLAWARFGGLVIASPRPFVRMVLIGVFGWLGLSLLVWLLAGARRELLLVAVDAVGRAHRAPLVAAVVTVVFGVLFEILGPGRVMSVLALGLWFPALLVRAGTVALELSNRRAVVATAFAYPVWLLSVGRHLLGQVEHLL